MDSNRFRDFSSAVLLGVMAMGGLVSCYAEVGSSFEEEEDVGQVTSALVDDALADAFALFSGDMAFTGLSNNSKLGAGYHPGLCTERIKLANKAPASAKATFNFSQQQLTAVIEGIDTTQSFDLWFVKNVEGAGRSVKPETGDQMLKVGSFSTVTTTQGGPARSLSVNLGANIDYDLDLLVVTRPGQSPTASRVLVGSRSLLEKRLFRERLGRPMPAVTGTQLNTVETNDPLVKRGAFVFFNETFGGNGRTCGTCHRLENNLALDAKFIATLPSTDPLFVYNSNPALVNLEKGPMLTGRGLILENVDGFANPTTNFSLRSVPHLFGMAASMNIAASEGSYPTAPADNRIGWGGDGAPGRGTLSEMGFGAIIQHLTKRLDRVPGVDYRIPTQEELDALEAFELFSGRQRRPNVASISFREAAAQTGKQNFFGNGLCTQCHRTMTGAVGVQLLDAAANTGVNQRVTDLPADDGFGQPMANQSQLGAQVFDPPPLIEAADTGPFFHNNSAAAIEDAITHYTTSAFLSSPGGAQAVNSTFSAAQVASIGIFLRQLNAAENVRRMRKLTVFVRDNRSTGNTALIAQAVRNCDSALRMLREKNVNAAARSHLSAARTALVNAQAQADTARAANIGTALTNINLAKTDILSSDPNSDF